jgi:hypothetical protein
LIISPGQIKRQAKPIELFLLAREAGKKGQRSLSFDEDFGGINGI